MLRPIRALGRGGSRKAIRAIVTNITDAEVQLVQDMVETMYKAPGVGLAAPQVGVGKRIMVTDPSAGEETRHLITIINPEIAVGEGEQYEDEGCLSIPGFSAIVLRPKKVVLSGVDLNGKGNHRRRQRSAGAGLLSRDGSSQWRLLPGSFELSQTRSDQTENQENDSRRKVGIRQLVFMGSATFAVPTLERIFENGYAITGVITQPDKPTVVGQTLQVLRRSRRR